MLIDLGKTMAALYHLIDGFDFKFFSSTGMAHGSS
jgi:hypothetical protein|tara:strand:+ start:1579 stop:1683 length:105 start_codon:yes stop_codon:yes gene_type:complete